ncbi:MAG: DUF1570 domain-containing protein [Planctomycetes bacterium]|nr:DUF1570 domain-containing protein [Planctomycetota bacterium]
MLSRIIALAIFFITTAAIHAEYYLIRVDLTKPLEKGPAAGAGVGVPMPPGGVPMPMPVGPGIRPPRPKGPGAVPGEGGFSGGIIESGEFTLNSRFVFTVVELNKRLAVPQLPYIIVDQDNKITQQGAPAGQPAGQPGGAPSAQPVVTDAKLKVGHWNRFDHPWNGKTMPLVTTDVPGAITGEYFVPNSSMQFVQIISDESIKGKAVALPSLSKILTERTAGLKDKKSVSDVVDKVGKFALEHGMTKEFKDTMDLLIKESKSKSPIIEIYSKTKKATEEKGNPDPAFAALSKSFVGFSQENSDHFEVIHDGLPNDPEVKLWVAQLEKNYSTFFMWFSLHGTQIELPKNKLSVVITTKPDVYNEMHLSLIGNKPKAQGFILPREKLLVLCTKRLDPISEMLGLKMKEWTTKGYDFNQLLIGKIGQGHPPAADILEVVYAGALAVLNRALDQETVWNTIGNFGTLQLFYATKTLPTNVVLPKWFSEGLAGVFETPHCSPWMSFGSANSYHLPLFRQIYKNKRTPVEFEAILSRLLANTNAPNLSPQAGQEQFNTESWALVYFLVKKKQSAFMAFCKDFEMLPKDVVLSQSLVTKIFNKHFLTADSNDVKKAKTNFCLEWIDFIFTENLEGEKFFVDLRRIQSEMLKTQDLSVSEDPSENMILRLLLEGGLETSGVPGNTQPGETGIIPPGTRPPAGK